MSVTRHHARVTWERDKQDLRAHTVRLADQTIACSSAAELGGNESKADPEELFVAALSTCHMLWFLDFARRERLRVTGYEDQAEGVMDGTRFTEVVLRPRLSFQAEVSSATVESLHHRAHEACFIANSVSCPVRVEAA